MVSYYINVGILKKLFQWKSISMKLQKKGVENRHSVNLKLMYMTTCSCNFLKMNKNEVILLTNLVKLCIGETITQSQRLNIICSDGTSIKET